MSKLQRLEELCREIVSVTPYDHEYGNCIYCNGCDEGTGGRKKGRPAHDPECPWQGIVDALALPDESGSLT